jgi:4-diphosphocytidyl-2-C-methyl-D-erythritol kinase
VSELTAGASSEFAPAKVNLALHVTGRRSDGYHLLDSVVVFLALGDRLHVAPAENVTLAVTGPLAVGVPVDGNLVLRAATAIAHAAGRPCPGASLTLDKHIPAAAGLGGGSSDAAAALRALNRMWGIGLDSAELMRLGETIGADVPVCVAPTAARMAGIGECVAPLPALPQVHVLLVNPGCGLATTTVFAGLTNRDNPGLPELPGRWQGVAHLVDYLAACRNDLAAPAIAAAPAIQEVLAALAAEPACLLARMSGSGATCFGLFATAEDAARASARLARQHPGWWVAAARTL